MKAPLSPTLDYSRGARAPRTPWRQGGGSLAIGIVLAVTVFGCAPAAQAPGVAAQVQSSGPKHLTVAIMEGLFSLNSDIGLTVTVSSTAGSPEVERLVNGGLVVVGDDGNPRPELSATPEEPMAGSRVSAVRRWESSSAPWMATTFT